MSTKRTNLPILGKILKAIKRVDPLKSLSGSDAIYFLTEDNEIYEMSHGNECCEHVCIEDINGNLNDLIGSPITLAEEATQIDENASEFGAWTFYRLATIKGRVDIRWYGESNGWYSVEADFCNISCYCYDNMIEEIMEIFPNITEEDVNKYYLKLYQK